MERKIAVASPVRHLELDAIKNIREEPDLIDRAGGSFRLVVLKKKDIAAIGDILQIQIKSGAKPVLMTVEAVAEFGVEPEVIAEPLGIVMKGIIDLITGSK